MELSIAAPSAKEAEGAAVLLAGGTGVLASPVLRPRGRLSQANGRPIASEQSCLAHIRCAAFARQVVAPSQPRGLPGCATCSGNPSASTSGCLSLAPAHLLVAVGAMSFTWLRSSWTACRGSPRAALTRLLPPDARLGHRARRAERTHVHPAPKTNRT